MPPERPTRWEKAKRDTTFWRPKREAVVGAVAVLFTAVVLWYFGYAEGIVEYLIPVAVGALVAVVVAPLAELAWNWLQAPMRLVADDVVAIRARLDSAPIDAEPRKPPVNPRVTLFELHAQGAAFRNRPLKSGAFDDWFKQVTRALAEEVSSAAAEEFLRATNDAGFASLNARLDALEAIAERQPQDPR